VDKPIVMGIINVTPDSFYSQSRYSNINEILRHAEQMLNEGATILDIGGQSSRPGSEPVGHEEELKRVIEPIQELIKKFPDLVLSIDTYHSKVAAEAVAAGASIVNDISAGAIDNDMIGIVAGLSVPYIAMHMKGIPATMQKEPFYEDVTREVLDFFISKTYEFRQNGIKDLIIDPGFGFGKTIAHNFELLRNLSVFKILERPILLGISRKSTISKTLGINTEQALNGTTVLHTIGILNGACILRAHDVKEAMETITLTEAYLAVK
jgi:dihydropteroate synthase